MTNSPTSVSFAQLSEVLDAKISQVALLRTLLSKELHSFHTKNDTISHVTNQLQALDWAGFRLLVNQSLGQYHSQVLATFQQLDNFHAEQLTKFRTGYQRQISELQLELQKQYKLTRNMKAQVEELKSLVDSFMKQKQLRKQEEIKVEAAIPQPNVKQVNPTLQIITEEDENQSTKREPEEGDSPINLQNPRISIKEYITLECLQNTLGKQQEKSDTSLSPRFKPQVNRTLMTASPKKSAESISITPSKHSSTSSKKPAKFFLEEFKKSFEKAVSQNSAQRIERKDNPTQSSNLDADVFSLEDSKRFESNHSTPTGSQLFAKITFGKQKKFFSQIDQSEGMDSDEQKELRQQLFIKPRERSMTTKSKQKEREPLAEKPVQPSYLVNHIKKKLNYNSMSNSNSGNHIRDKQRESSYSSRDKTSSNNRQDRYKLLIRNILNIKEKQNHHQSVILSREKDKKPCHIPAQMPPQPTNTNKQIQFGLFVGDRKMEIKYEGSKQNGKRHGRGTLYYSNGLAFQGEFRDGARSGYGVLKFNHIEIYNGDWQNDMLNGQGRIKNCSIINKKRKQSTNNGTLQLHRWISYSGEFKDNKFHGTGTLFLQNGEKFLGKFIHGVAQGEGTFYKTNGEVEFGIWKNNVFCQKF